MKPFYHRTYPDRTVTIWEHQHLCRCGRDAFLFVTRGGITYCLGCEPRKAYGVVCEHA